VTLHKYVSTAQKFSDSKIKKGIFVGPQITAMIRGRKFEGLLRQMEKSTRKSFKSVVKIFFRKS
jgi:hypothetical protein